jgi:hypothetical protein
MEEQEGAAMRLSILAAAAALIACPVADAQAPDAPTVPPRPMRDTPVAQPPLKPPPATLSDAEAACQRGDQPACEEAARIQAKLSGGVSGLDPPPASGGGGSPQESIR